MIKKANNVSSEFNKNMQRHKLIADALSEHGLEIKKDAVIDITLTAPMNRIVCNIDTREIDLSSAVDVFAYPEIAQYLTGGRECYIKSFKREQAAAHAWSNR